jgi:ribose 5-phosphate isomerase B
MKIAIGSDHAGFRYKELLRAHLAAQGHEVRDFGTHSPDPVDYPVFVRPVAEAVARGDCGLQ